MLDPTDACLDAKRMRGDAAGDQVAGRLMRDGAFAQVDSVFGALQQNDQAVPDGAPNYVKAFFNEGASLPEWASPEMIVEGQRVFERYGPLVLTLLLFRSLPMCYAAWPGVKVVRAGGKLARGPRRRALETTRFVMDVMSRGGLTPGGDGRGIRSAQKVRLVHGMLRARLLGHSWDTEAHGLPINQEDLAGTMLAFSVVITEGLKMLHIDLTTDEEEGFLHAWKVAGHLLGMDADLLPKNVAAALELQAAIERRHFKESEDGKLLAGQLIGLSEEIIPGRLFDGFATSMTRYLVGAETARILGLEESDWTRHLIHVFSAISAVADEVTDSAEPLKEVGAYVGAAVMRGLVEMERGDKEMEFAVADQLQEEWAKQYPQVSYDLWHRVLRFWRGVRNRMRERLL